MRTRPLTPEDAARLHMSTPVNPMTITALLVLDAPLTREVVIELLEERLLRHERFRWRVVEPRLGLGMPRWAEDPRFDVREHVEQIDVSADVSLDVSRRQSELENVLGAIASMPFDDRRPPWRVHLLSHPGGGGGLVVSVHHALADGAALLEILEDLVDERAPAEEVPDVEPSRAAPSRGRRLLAGVLSAGRLALRRADPRTPLRGRLGVRKCVAFSSAVPLPALIDTAHALETTVAGVLLAAVAGALRAELGPHHLAEGLALHALLPINLPRESPHALGNRYGSVLVPLAVGTADIGDRARRARDDLRTLRARGAVIAGARLASAAGVMTAATERLGVAFFSRKASVTVSNVRGPARALHLGGATVSDLLVWAPSPGSIALGITLMSYAGRARLAVAADAAVIGDARRLVRALERELAALASFAPSVRGKIVHRESSPHHPRHPRG